MTWLFDLQLFGKGNNGSQQINNSDQYYQQLAGDSSGLMNQFNQMYLPMIQQLLPELQGVVNGTPNNMTTAAQAPVNAQTSSSLNTIQNNLGGVANPNALYSDIALQGQQTAGLAGDSMISQALSGLQNLAGMGYGGVSAGMGGLNNAAGGEGNLGLNLQQQSNQWWQSLLSAAGSAAAMSAGAPPGAVGMKPSSSAPQSFMGASWGNVPSASAMSGGSSAPQSYYTGIAPSTTQANGMGGSAPISSMGPQP